MRKNTGFTFVEFIFVVVILSLMAAIAVPNFLEAQTRAQIARARADLTAMAFALETYRIDHRAYPPNRTPRAFDERDLIPLTTPINYISRLPELSQQSTRLAVFERPRYLNFSQIYTEDVPLRDPLAGNAILYCLAVPGPDGDIDINLAAEPITFIIYDPTNGTLSNGDTSVFGP